MKQMRVSDKDWCDLKQSINMGRPSEQVWIVSGPAEQLSIDMETLLTKSDSILYFLCCGNKEFHVPCYKRFVKDTQEDQIARPPGTFLIDKAGSDAEQQMHSTDALLSFIDMQQLKERHPSLFLIECLTSPSQKEKCFFKLIVINAIRNGVSVGFVIHDEEANDDTIQDAAAQFIDELGILYLYGGCARSQEWQRIIGRDEILPVNPSLFTIRHVGEEQWFCYANGTIARLAEKLFWQLQHSHRQLIAERVLNALSDISGYPVLEIARQTNNLQSVLQFYTRDDIERALDEPNILLAYFNHLQYVASLAGNEDIACEANLNYIAALLYLHKVPILALYRKLQTKTFSCIDREIEAHFWFTLGQQLARIYNEQAWQYAGDCFERSRRATLDLTQTHAQQRALRLAAIENGEALIAYKRKQKEKAYSLERSALERIADIRTSPLKFHLLMNVGQLYEKLFVQVDAALEQYEAALTYASRLAQTAGNTRSSKVVAVFVHTASLKLSALLLNKQRYNDAIHCLKEAVGHLESILDYSQDTSLFLLFNLKMQIVHILLTAKDIQMAQIYMQQILQKVPIWFPPEKIKSLVLQFQQNSNILDQTFLEHISQKIADREKIVASIIDVQHFVMLALEERYEQTSDGTADLSAPSH